jgi:hypothetical protein
MVSQLDVEFWVGSGLFGVGGILSLLFSYLVWRWRLRENMGCYAALCNLAMCMMYLLFGRPCDWGQGFVFRADGINAPWIRGVTNTIVYMSFARFVAVGVAAEGNAARYALLMSMIAGPFFLLAEISNYAWSWLPWAVGVIACFGQNYILAKRSTDHSWRAFWFYLGSMVFQMGTPLTLALSWCMSQTLDTAPNREWSEFMYLLINVLGVLVYTMVSTFVYLPAKTRAVVTGRPEPKTF